MNIIPQCNCPIRFCTCGFCKNCNTPRDRDNYGCRGILINQLENAFCKLLTYNFMKKTFQVVIPPDLIKQVKKAADKEERSISFMIRKFIKDGLKNLT